MKSSVGKTLALVASLLAVCLAVPAAQLLPANDTGMTMGHVLLNVDDIQAHRNFWVTQFDAVPVKVGRLDGIKIPGLIVLFRAQHRTGPGEGEAINHMGLKLNKLSEFTARFEKAGCKPHKRC